MWKGGEKSESQSVIIKIDYGEQVNELFQIVAEKQRSEKHGGLFSARSVICCRVGSQGHRKGL